MISRQLGRRRWIGVSLCFLFSLTVPGRAEDIVRTMLGINMCYYADWGPGQVVVDLMKQARPFGTVSRWWAGEAPCDSLGWPTTDAGTTFAMDEQAGYIQTGTYKLSFTGKATVSSADSKTSIKGATYDAENNKTTADVVVASGAGVISLLFTKTTGGIRNVKLIRPGYVESDLIVKEFIKSLEPFSVIRTLNWMGDESYQAPWVKEWNEERHGNYSTYTTGTDKNPTLKKSGVAKEFQIAIANKTMKDLWINLPLFASYDYIRELAKLVRDSLNPNLRFYFEICNEVWNFAYPYGTATNANREAASAEASQYGYGFDGNTDQYNGIPPRRIARLVTEYAKIFAEVLGSDQVPTRIRPVLAWQTGSGAYEPMLKYIVNRYGADAPKKYIYAISSAPYAGGSSISEMQSYSASQNSRNNLQLITTAKKYGVQPIAYEGGNHPNPIGTQDAAMQVDPAMGTLIYNDLKNQWFGQGGGLFCYYMLVSKWATGHPWGAAETMFNLDVPKYQALVKLAGELPKETVPSVGVGVKRVRSEKTKPQYAIPLSKQEVFHDVQGRRIRNAGTTNRHVGSVVLITKSTDSRLQYRR